MFLEHGGKIALIDRENEYTYDDIKRAKNEWLERLQNEDIIPGMVVGVQSDFSFSAISLLFALFENKNIAALVSPSLDNAEELLTECQGGFLFAMKNGEWLKKTLDRQGETHPLIQQLNEAGKAGFIVFSSGTTGKPKAILHDLEKFQTSLRDARKSFRTLAFLLLDHIAGVDTLLYTFKSGGSLVVTEERTPKAVCSLVERFDVEVLPVSPSFINLLFISKDYQEFNFPNLKIVTLGSEPVNTGLLDRARAIFPKARIIQKYGTSEFGSPRTKTKENDATWLLMESEFLRTKIIDDILWVKTDTTMLGYLNREEQPIKDGWYCTGDKVEVDGDWIRVLGRESDIINVGGEKVFPSEVESVITELDWVEDCLVYGEENPLLGNIVCVRIKTDIQSPTKEILKNVRKHCLTTLERYKVPVSVTTTRDDLVSIRQKKTRI